MTSDASPAPGRHPGPAGAGEAAGTQYLTFRLDGEEYGVEILRVQEIKGWEPCTRLPNTPEYLLGVINLRGSVVPIVDLRRRLGMAPLEADRLTVVIVLCLPTATGDKTLGLMVDAVADVVEIAAEQIRPAPPLDSAMDTGFLRGLATVDDKMIILLDLEHVADDC